MIITEFKNFDGNLLILTQWSFKDALVQTYTLPYVSIIRSKLPIEKKIFIVTYEQGSLALTAKEVEDINAKWAADNIELLVLPYRRYGVKKLLSVIGHIRKLVALIKKNKISLTHSFCTTAGSTAYILKKLTGVPFIIDSYEPHAEVMTENGTWPKDGTAYKILFGMEKRLTKGASVVIGTTAAMKEYALTRYQVVLKDIFVKPACINLDNFHPESKDSDLLKQYGLENKIVCVYAGKLGGIYLKEEVFDFIKQCYHYWGEQFRFLMLTNASRAEIDEQIKRVSLPDHVVISKFCLHHEVSKHLSLGDFGINPVKPGPTRRYCTSIKDGEYWAKGLPVVITKNISDDSEIIAAHNAGYVLEELNEENYRNAVVHIDTLLQGNRKELQEKIFSMAQQYRNYSIAENIYQQIYAN